MSRLQWHKPALQLVQREWRQVRLRHLQRGAPVLPLLRQLPPGGGIVIGSRVTCTIWQVTWSHRNPAVPDAQPIVARQMIVTGDPSGADVHAVTQLAVLGAAATPAHEFRIIGADRVADAEGLAMLAGGRADRGWPADLPAGAAIADGCNHLQGRIGELGHRLALAEAKLRRQGSVVDAAARVRAAADRRDAFDLGVATDELISAERELVVAEAQLAPATSAATGESS